MYKFYRPKQGGLCYHVLGFSAIPYDKMGQPFITPRMVVIQHMQGNIYYLPETDFWEQFVGVENENIPPAYRTANDC